MFRDWYDRRIAPPARRIVAAASMRLRAGQAFLQDRGRVRAAVRRMVPTARIIGGALLSLVVAVVLFAALFDWNLLRGPIGRWASAKYDRQIALTGDMDVKLLSWTPTVVVRGLKVGGPDWARDRDTADVDEVRASVRLAPLLIGRVEMPLLSITRPRVVMISDRQGRKSWRLDADRPDDGRGAKLPPIERLIIRDGALTFEEQRRGLSVNATVNAQETAGGTAGSSWTAAAPCVVRP
ncbi:AsmA family protein [Brevundimonas sp.]|uniref:AsmA family protein n=1 Tax=Brevundimonas sp. TaxID=1871086 RepID=UPI0028AC4E42|nr:AsmA family protein [Brevundimonas sp.]